MKPNKKPNKTAKKVPAKPAKKTSRERLPSGKKQSYPTEKPSLSKPAVSLKLKNGNVLKAPAPRIAQNGYTRPTPSWSDGRPKVTARVWQLADELAAAAMRPPTRVEMLAAVEKFNKTAPAVLKITYAVFQNQFYRWRKFNGLFGRVKKDGTMARLTGGPSDKRVDPVAVAAAKPAVKPPVKKPAPKKPAKPVATKPAAKPLPAAKPAQMKLPFPVPAIPAKSAPQGSK